MYRPENIRAAMAAKRLTQMEVAERSGLSQKTISAVCNGDPDIKLKTLVAVVEAVGLKAEIRFLPCGEEQLEPAA